MVYYFLNQLISVDVFGIAFCFSVQFLHGFVFSLRCLTSEGVSYFLSTLHIKRWSLNFIQHFQCSVLCKVLSVSNLFCFQKCLSLFTGILLKNASDHTTPLPGIFYKSYLALLLSAPCSVFRFVLDFHLAWSSSTGYSSQVRHTLNSCIYSYLLLPCIL